MPFPAARRLRQSSHPSGTAWRLVVAAAVLPVSAFCRTALERATGNAELEEIVVTARGIAEDLFGVPMSVQALSGDFIDATDSSSLFEMQMDVPGSPIRGVGDLSVLADYNYRSDFFFTRANLPEESQDAYGLLNLFLRLEPTSESWYAFASARNVLDTDYFNQVFLESSVGQPANYELGFGLRF